MILGLAGEAESGKSAFASSLVEKHDFKELSFAKNLKEMCKGVFNLSDYDVYDTKGKEAKFESPLMLLSEHLVEIKNWIKGQTPKVRVSDIGLSVSIQDHTEFNTVLFNSPREVLQFIGTEVCRECYSQSYHIDVIKEQIYSHPRIVISDARFINERKIIKEWGGFNIKIEDSAKVTDKTAGLEGHQSEAEMNTGDYDVTFLNDKHLGFDVLHQRVSAIYAGLKNEIFEKHS